MLLIIIFFFIFNNIIIQNYILDKNILTYLIINFNLVKGDTDEECTLYASHSSWNSQDDFINWTKSEAFKLAHKNAGQHKDIYIGHPVFEGFNVVV